MNDIRFDVRNNFKDFVNSFANVSQRQVAKAQVDAMNRTAVTARAEGARELRKAYPGMKVGIIKKQIKLTRANRVAASAELDFSGKRFRLYGNFRLPLRRTIYGTGIAARMRLPFALVNGANQPLTEADFARAFLQRGRGNGSPNVFVRQGRARYPLDVVLARGVGAAFDAFNLGEYLTKVSARRFPAAFTQALQFRGVI